MMIYVNMCASDYILYFKIRKITKKRSDVYKYKFVTIRLWLILHYHFFINYVHILVHEIFCIGHYYFHVIIYKHFVIILL